MGIISFAILILITFYCLWRFQDRTDLKLSDLLVGWTVKLICSVLFILIFSHYYGYGHLYGDADNFIRDSKQLADFGIAHPWEYIKLMIGISPEPQLFYNSPLVETNIWSYGENGDFMNDNRLIIRINSIIHFFSFGNIYVHGLVLSFLSFFGLLLIYQTFVKYVNNPRFFYYTIVLFPSVLFWGSGITKEAVLIFGLGLFFYGLFKIGRDKLLRYLFGIVVGGLIIVLNKPHVGLAVISLSPVIIIGRWLNWKTAFLIVVPIMTLIIATTLTYTPSKFNLLDKISYKQKDLVNMGKGGIFFINDSSFCAFDFKYLDHFKQSNPKKITVLKDTKGEYKLFGQSIFYPFTIPATDTLYDVYLIQPPSTSYIDIPPINYSRTALLKSIPVSILNTTIRPFPWDPGRNFKYLAFISNLLFLSFLIFSLLKFRKTTSQEKYFLTYFIISALVILLLIGWTTPILGAVVRYKVASELFILIALSISLKKLKNDVH